MAFLCSSWRFVTVLAALCALSFGIGCGGKKDPDPVSSNTNVTISGTVTYTRVPLVSNPDGTPLGLETDSAKFKSLPLRGVVVRAFQGKTEPDGSGNTVTVWKLVATTATASDGKYTVNVPRGELTFMEVISSAVPQGSALRIMADDISSSTPLPDRPFYSMRKGADGLSSAGDQTPGSILNDSATVDFSIDLTAPWWIAPVTGANSIIRTTAAGVSPTTTWSPNALFESVGTGSRVAAIIDSAFTFSSTVGDPTPGATLILHYKTGASNLRPTYVEFDRLTFPLSFDGNSLNYFGLIRGNNADDDAWDEGVLFQLFAKNWLVSQHFIDIFPTDPLVDRSDLQDLRPDMALLEGFSQAIAATLQKSPHLADTSAGATNNRDIRVTSGLGSDAYSAANIAAIAWKLNLYANGTNNAGVITPIADTPAGWANLSQVALKRFFTVAFPRDSSSGFANDIGSIYSQVARLREIKAPAEPVDLASYFPDATLTTLLAPFNIPWPRPTTVAAVPDPLVPEAGFVANWGANPNSTTTALPEFTLSMANAHQNRLNLFPNFSKGEIYNARFTLSGDKIYQLNLLTPAGIPSGAQVEVSIGGKAYYFENGTPSIRLPALIGNSATPVNQTVQVRLLSPNIRQADLLMRLRLDPQN